MSDDPSIHVGPATESEAVFHVTPRFLKGTIRGGASVSATLTSVPASYDTPATHRDVADMARKPHPDLRVDFYLRGANAEVVIHVLDEDSDESQVLWRDVEAVLSEDGGTTKEFIDTVARFLLAKLGERPA